MVRALVAKSPGPLLCTATATANASTHGFGGNTLPEHENHTSTSQSLIGIPKEGSGLSQLVSERQTWRYSHLLISLWRLVGLWISFQFQGLAVVEANNRVHLLSCTEKDVSRQPQRRNYLTRPLTSDLPPLAHCNAPGSRRLLNRSSPVRSCPQSSPDSTRRVIDLSTPTSHLGPVASNSPHHHHHLFLRPTIFASRIVRLPRRQL
jgi:hypothetical protein